jgi:hypothetical protein
MGLFSKLQNGDTVLKSLKFGNDRPGGGNSGQPYIKNPLIDEPGKLSRVDDDFLLRGGLRAPINAIEDVTRLTKYMFDFKSPKGLMFIAKQNLLSRVSVATEASISAGYANNPAKELAWTKAPLNQGIYTPLSTILQAGVGYSGLHLNLLGINPFTPMTGIVQGGFLPGIGLVRYEDVVRGETRLTKTIEVERWVPKSDKPKYRPAFNGSQSVLDKSNQIKVKEKQRVPIGQYENRLIYLWGKDMTNTGNAGGTVLTYSGGPGSVLGIGKTKIKFADQRTGLNNPLSSTEFKYFYKGGNRLHEFDSFYQWQLPLGATSKYIEYDETKSFFPYELIKGNNSYEEITIPKLFEPGTLKPRMVLTGSEGYQVGLKRPETEVNYNNLLGASKEEGLDDIQTGIDPTNGTNFNLYGPHTDNTTLSKYNPGLSLTGDGGYQIGNSLKNPTQESGSTYYSQIGDTLKNKFNRQLVTSSKFDDSNQSGNASTWAATNSDGKIIPSYSSDNTLRRDFTNEQINDASGGLWDNFNKYYGYGNGDTKHEKGYLADLDKNAGAWKDSSGILTTNNNNAYPGGIAPDFRLVPRKIRGLYSPPASQQPPESLIPQTNGKISKGVGEISNTWITEGGDLSPSAIDTIYYNSNSIHKSSFRTSNALGGNDVINFRITVIDPRKPNTGAIPLNFRAYIDLFSDSYNADWKGQTYMGRAEQFYKYNSFGRDMSLNFKIVADNKNNLIGKGQMYEQLNTLASSLAPTYTTFGYMAGNLHQLTVGNYVSNQTGIINSLSYEIMDESPWEIETGNQLPMYIAVSMKFTPIHNFRPEMKWGEDKHQFINQA